MKDAGDLLELYERLNLANRRVMVLFERTTRNPMPTEIEDILGMKRETNVMMVI